MAPKWPQVNNGPEHINEHATYLREACHQLQAVDRGRHNQVPWNIVQKYLESTIAFVGKVLQQPPMSDMLHHVQDVVKCTQNVQRDVSIIKNAVGLSTAPPNAINFSAGKAAASWAQVAAHGRGNRVPPPPVAQSEPTTKTKPTVTPYKDRAITVRLKDRGIAQRFRTLSTTKIRQQVEASIRNHSATKSAAVVAAHQLKSGDIQIFTSSTAGAARLRENKQWVRGLGEHAELIVPTYGVIAHGLPTHSINIKDQTATIQQILADNYTVIPKAEISHIGWLTRESPLKQASSAVVEFTDPEMANAIIYSGLAWEGRIHTCHFYDRACRVKQCFRCYRYGHIGTQCDAAQTCGYCAELHETKNCPQKGVEGFTPRCPVCKSAHTAWSNACPVRRKELERIEQAKRTRPTYWPVAPKHETHVSDNSRKRPRRTRSPTPDQVIAIDSPRASGQAEDPAGEPQTSREPVDTQAHPATPAAEDWATPASQQAPTPQQPTTNPQLLSTEQPQETGLTAANIPPADTFEFVLDDATSIQQSLYPLEPIQGEFDMTDADEWLANLESDNAVDRPHDPGTIGSIPTSMATNTRTGPGGLYKACRCPEHQEIYNTWPTEDAELTIAHCMKICMYCGKDFPVAAELRKHIKKKDYALRNLTPRAEKGKYSAFTPEWTHKPRTEPPVYRPRIRATQNRSPSNSPENAPLPC